ncbi:hypothetical protein BMT54_07090 [Pasteurellaceae bacterium 15-036681]|nr:hypothetical protein BMT54_07090 [Pasteurellaceae bacterium 15-036681]
MKYLQKWLVAMCLICAIPAKAGLLSISEKEINQYLETRLAEKVPLENSVGLPGLFQLDYKLHNLITSIGQTEEKTVEITGMINGILQVRNKKYDAHIQLNMDTVPYYDPEKGAIYLKDVRLLNWQAQPEKYQKELQMFLPLLADGVASILNNTPVYTLDTNNTKEAMVKKFGKAIIVDKGAIRLETSIF